MFKKTHIARSLVCGALLAASSGVSAGDAYYGGNLAFMDYSELGLDANVTTLYGRIGKNWNDNFSGEARLGFGLTDDTVEILGEDVDLKLSNFMGAYVRGGAQVSEAFYPYAILGFTRIDAKVSGFGESVSDSDTDVSFGLGADFNASPSVTLNLEYMNYYDKDGAELDAFSFGFTKAF